MSIELQLKSNLIPTSVYLCTYRHLYTLYNTININYMYHIAGIFVGMIFSQFSNQVHENFEPQK